MDSSKQHVWWLSAAQFAELAGVSAKTVKRWIKTGKFKGYQLNGKGEHRVLVLNIVKTCKDTDMSYILERFNERYTFNAHPFLRKAEAPGNTEA